MEITTTSADSTELLKVEVTGGDIEVKIGRICEEVNRSMTRNKTAEALAPTRIPVAILARLMTSKSVEKMNKSGQRR